MESMKRSQGRERDTFQFDDKKLAGTIWIKTISGHLYDGD